MILLAKIPYLAFSHYCANHFLDIFTPCFRSSQDQLSCHFSEKSKEEFGQNDNVNIQTGTQSGRHTDSKKKTNTDTHSVNRQADRQIYRHLSLCIYIYVYIYICIYIYVYIYICIYCRLAAYIRH